GGDVDLAVDLAHDLAVLVEAEVTERDERSLVMSLDRLDLGGGRQRVARLDRHRETYSAEPDLAHGVHRGVPARDADDERHRQPAEVDPPAAERRAGRRDLAEMGRRRVHQHETPAIEVEVGDRAALRVPEPEPGREIAGVS